MLPLTQHVLQCTRIINVKLYLWSRINGIDIKYHCCAFVCTKYHGTISIDYYLLYSTASTAEHFINFICTQRIELHSTLCRSVFNTNHFFSVFFSFFRFYYESQHFSCAATAAARCRMCQYKNYLIIDRKEGIHLRCDTMQCIARLVA